MFFSKSNLDLMDGARNLIRITNLKEGEKVVIVCDNFSDPLMIEAFRVAACEKNAEVTICVTPPLPYPGANPSEATMAAIEKGDVIFGCTTLSLAHGVAVMRARINSGARYATVSTLTAEELASEGAKFPPEIIDAIFDSFRKKDGKPIHLETVRVTDEKGTDVLTELPGDYGDPGRKGGKYSPGIPPGRRSGFPLGTCGLTPGGSEGNTNGVVYFDLIMGWPERLKEPVKYVIEDNWVTAIEGGEAAEWIKNMVVDDKRNSTFFEEIMFGLNPKAWVWSSIPRGHKGLMERHAGIMHMDMGAPQGRFYRGEVVRAKYHNDGVLFKPTMFLNDKKVIDAGRLLALDDPEVKKVAAQFGGPDEILREEETGAECFEKYGVLNL
jgi:uncharacterized protein YnzC (UPF0291/DUF896 family)